MIVRPYGRCRLIRKNDENMGASSLEIFRYQGGTRRCFKFWFGWFLLEMFQKLGCFCTYCFDLSLEMDGCFIMLWDSDSISMIQKSDLEVPADCRALEGRSEVQCNFPFRWRKSAKIRTENVFNRLLLLYQASFQHRDVECDFIKLSNWDPRLVAQQSPQGWIYSGSAHGCLHCLRLRFDMDMNIDKHIKFDLDCKTRL